MLLDLLSGKGSTVEKMCEALGWQAHTLRAALTRLPGGAVVERPRGDGATSYKLA
jgi:DNA-binding transcriptional regulator PaaX